MRSLTLSAAGLLGAAAAWAAPTEIPFDHSKTPDQSTLAGYRFAHGEEFFVVVSGTDTRAFEYDVTGITLVSDPPPADVTAAALDTSKKRIKMQHDSKYGGYIVRVSLKPDGQDGGLPASRTWYLFVETAGWKTELSTGLVGSKLVPAAFFLEKDANDVQRVQRDREAEDDLDFGFVGFATVFRDKGHWRWLGGSLGLGITGSELTVHAGLTCRLGQHASLTVGHSWRKVDQLPAGLAVGDAFAGALDELGLEPRTRGDAFFAVSIRGFTDGKGKELATASTKMKEGGTP